MEKVEMLNGDQKDLKGVGVGTLPNQESSKGSDEQLGAIGKYSEAIKNSLGYAESIQKALLPKDRHFARAFRDHFAIHWQKEGVGGDLYWCAKAHGKVYVAVADCTGHGVPGALLAVLGNSLLDYIVLGKEISAPPEILRELDQRLIASFQHSEQEYFHNDWIDISLCAIDLDEMNVEYAGAQRSILHVKDGEYMEYRGAKYPIGGWQLEENREFPSVSFSVGAGEALYLGSDGFQDQFGGPRDKKFGRKRLKELLLNMRERSMDIQKAQLEEAFRSWKGGREQVDDVCILGLRL